jgi:ATP-binding cassette subfamily B (MDR/TAP) protein 7
VLFFLLADADGSVVDLIIVLKDGQVAEQGTHEELLRLGGLYYNMWVQQASDNSLESLAES